MTDKCQWCGSIHGPRCPQVKAFEYFEHGGIKRVEFVTDADRPAVHTHDHSPRIVERQLSEDDKKRIANEYIRHGRA